MNGYFEGKRKKKGSYLYYGIVTAVIAAAMLVWGISLTVRGIGSAWSIIMSFIAAAAWGGTAGISFYVYRDANKTVLNSDSEDS